jgi:hypothetical protein
MLRALGIRSTPIRPPVTGADANGLNRPQPARRRRDHEGNIDHTNAASVAM